MASAILELLEDENLQRKFRENGPRTAGKFTWDRTVDKAEALFERVLKRGGGRQL
jgi:glycosyltransferase involved in cell wall biosynthesis